MSTHTEHSDTQAEFTIQRIYMKDSSFESPLAPLIFQQDWQPEMNLELHTQNTQLDESIHEVVLTVTVTVKANDKTAFLVEGKQAGIFSIKNFSQEQMGPLLGSVCPNILYPYARELISDLVNRGGFPPLYLAPINFDALYQQHAQQPSSQQEIPVTAS